MSEKEISKGEFRSVCQVVGGINAMINEDCKDRDALALVKYISENQKEEKLLANRTPIVRNGKQATVGVRTRGLEKLGVRKGIRSIFMGTF